MNIPQYWAKGKSTTGDQPTAACWGWSNISHAEAEQLGQQRAGKIAEIIRAGIRPDHYHYGQRPLREQILETWTTPDDQATPYASITRNSYGCEILNTTNAMFIDVDLPEPPPSGNLKNIFKGFFGKKSPGPSPREKHEAEALAKIQTITQADPRAGIRAYRTKAGLRYLLTNMPADPTDEFTLALMDTLGADPLYIQLCKVQACFRARLTPKPWRCNFHPPTITYPYPDQDAESQAHNWLKTYSEKAEPYATCQLIQHYGSTKMDDQFNRIVQHHDQTTKADSSLPLA